MGAVKELKSYCTEAAQRFLWRNGYDILECGWGSDGESVDFVLKDEEGTLVFLDVNAREGSAGGFPKERKASKERGRFERVALSYIESHWTPECKVRFDVLSVVILGADRAMLRHHLGAYSAA